jgi:hypothetical protein
MCILIHHPANVAFDDNLLNDFYAHNSDGFGAMYVENGSIVVVKTLGKPAEINTLYRDTLKGRECVIHYRMKTHGDIDLDNCHPYKVTDDLWMAHNGILSMGNPIDPRKSDTWHFIEYIIKPAMLANPNIILDPDYQAYIEKMIGAANKFAFLHSSGEIVVLNYAAGVEHQGAWLSNTYAWSAHKHGHGAKRSYGGWDYDDALYDDRYGGYTTYRTQSKGKPVSVTKTAKQSSALLGWDEYDPEGKAYGDYDEDFENYNIKPKKMSINKVVKAAHNCYRRGIHQLVDWVVAAPDKAEYLLIESYGEKEEGEMRVLVDADPEEAAAWIWDLFDAGNYDKDVAI